MRTFGVKIAAAEMGLCAYFLPHRRGVEFFLRVFYRDVVAVSVARVSFLVRVFCAARCLLMLYNGVQLEETKRKEVAS